MSGGREVWDITSHALTITDLSITRPPLKVLFHSADHVKQTYPELPANAGSWGRTNLSIETYDILQPPR